METRQFDMALIEKCATIRAERQDRPNIQRINSTLNSVNYKTVYKVLDMTELSTAQFIQASRSIKDGHALQLGFVAERMTIATDARVTCFIKDEFGDSGYTLIGNVPCNFQPLEGKITHIDLYCDSDGYGNWFYFHQLEIWLVGSYGFVVTVITAPGSDVTWADVLDDPKKGPGALIEARENARDFSYFWDETIFG